MQSFSKPKTSVLRGIRWLGLVCSSIVLCCWPARANTYTAASTAESDVQAAVNRTSNGDTVQIPCSGSQSVTWTTDVGITTNITITALGATPNIGAATFGAGTNCLTILDNNITGTPGLFNTTPTYSSSSNVLTIQNINIEPLSGTASAISSPIYVIGICTSSGCPEIRLDNLLFSGWTDGGQATWMIRADNVFGVVDHDTLASSDTSVQALVNINNGTYLGVGQFGDNSWAEADTYGTANELYLENNLSQGIPMTDCDIAVGDTTVGGCRYTGRFNQFPEVGGWAFAPHGTETGGRLRGGRQQEVYDNSFTCVATNGCNAAIGYRSAMGFVFDNAFITSATINFNTYIELSAYRTWASFKPYGGCNGEGPWDQNDGASQTSASTITSTTSTTLTDSSQSWTTNQFAPGSHYYTLLNATNAQRDGIVSNTATTLTLTQPVSWSAGNTYYILGTTLYAKGTVTSVSGTITITDTSQSWSASQWVANGDPYTLIDISSPYGGFVGDVGWEITGSTSNTVSSAWYSQDYFNGPPTVSVGDTYIILRASVCLDQPARGGGNLLSGDATETTVPTPISYINETLEPIYEWGDTISGQGPGSHPGFGPFQIGTMKLLLGRDYYEETVNQGAQSNSTAPFDGTATGTCGGSYACNVGHGTLANRPTTCTQGVGYWATDQGNWNQSGSGGQGELYTCTGTNIWTMTYEPYTYPHPLITGSTLGTGVTRPNPPTDPTATVQQ